jgi:predicted nucleic acid-binding protein
MKYYLDSCILIYMIEKVEDYRKLVLDFITEDSELIISDFTKLECRVKPIKEKNKELLNEYDEFFLESANLINLTSEVMEKATSIRAEYNFKTPDFIHLACAVLSKSDFFITNDKRLSDFKELKILCLTSQSKQRISEFKLK